MPSEVVIASEVLGAPTVTQVMYTDTELMKIYVSGAVLVIAILIITYYAYMWWKARLQNWQHQEEIKEKIALGMKVPAYVPVDQPINKAVFYVVGAAIILIGIIQIVL